MPGEPASRLAIHATAVAVGDRALLICGTSRAGKSRLAIALIARSSPALPICLIGDDRILLARTADGLVAYPHPRIAGFIERRGLGLVAMPWVRQGLVGGIVDLGSSPPLAPYDDHDGRRIPVLRLDCAGDAIRAESVLAWWAEVTAARAPHLFEKAAGTPLADAKD